MKKHAKQTRGKVTTQTILEAASQVLVTEGYARATTNRIAERAGVSVGTLYAYFGNKEDIYQELLEQIHANLLRSLEECPPQPSLRELLETYNRNLLQMFNEDSVLIQSLQRLLSGPFQAQRNEGRDRVVQAFTDLLRPHRNEITCEDLEVGARVVVCATEGVGSDASSIESDPEGVLSHLLRLQLAYLTSEL